MTEHARDWRNPPAHPVTSRHPSADDTREPSSALVERLMPVAWALVQAVHDRDPVRVSELVNSAKRLDVIAIILASQMPHGPRTSLAGQAVDCGTREGFGEHIRRREPSCVACRTAHAASNPSYAARSSEESRAAARQGVLDLLHRRRRGSGPH
jgi:hypothetical protein